MIPAYADCTKDAYCAARAVQGYMSKFAQVIEYNKLVRPHGFTRYPAEPFFGGKNSLC